jgi:hypothetical protein
MQCKIELIKNEAQIGRTANIHPKIIAPTSENNMNTILPFNFICGTRIINMCEDIKKMEKTVKILRLGIIKVCVCVFLIKKRK